MRIYTYGVYDLFHAGHVRSLKDAKAAGDYLIVGIFRDKTAESFKRKPIIDEAQRMEVVKACKYVDEVVYQEELSPEATMKAVDADKIAKGPGAGFEDLEIDGKVLLEYNDINSTTSIIKKICS